LLGELLASRAPRSVRTAPLRKLMQSRRQALCYRVPTDEQDSTTEEAVTEAEQYGRMPAARDGATVTGTWTRCNTKNDMPHIYVEALALPP
jgi:hypothetical protein